MDCFHYGADAVAFLGAQHQEVLPRGERTEVEFVVFDSLDGFIHDEFAVHVEERKLVRRCGIPRVR